MYEILLALLAVFLIFLFPGLSLGRILRLPFANIWETLFYSISLSLAAIVGIGFVLGTTVGINQGSVLAAFLFVSIIGIASISLSLWNSLQRARNPWKIITAYSAKARSKVMLAGVAAVAVTAINWSSAIGTHPVDMGEHVFWAKVIMTTSRLPNYYSVEPLDQAVKFTYGAHLILAQFFLVAGIPIEDYSWIPPLVGSIGLWIGIVLFTFRVTRSKWAAILAGIFYGSAFQPGAYIERGNLPDIAGYLLLVCTLYSVLRIRNDPSFSYALGLTAVSIIPYHQLAAVILPTVILFALTFAYFRSRPELIETLRSGFGGRARPTFWGGMLFLALAYSAALPYVSGSAVSQLVTGNWRPYVTPPYNDLLVPGTALGVLGAGGFVVILMRKTLSHMLLVAWLSGLLFLANALIVGIPIPDPGRFLWRLTEPLSIMAAILTYSSVKVSRNSKKPIASSSVRDRRDWIRLGVAMLILIIIAFQVTSIVTSTPRYQASEVFYQDDKRIGQWLAVNASSTSVIVNDADVDQTATWVQPFSMKFHFIYRADFAVIVAPANYVEIYKSTAILYESPSDDRVPQIIQRYNITYVIAHTDEIRLFDSSPFFVQTPVFRSGNSALFETKS